MHQTIHKIGLNFFRICIFVLIFIFVFLTAQNILARKDSIQKMEDFYAQKEDFDVLFFGSSHSLFGMAPMEMWHQYGMVSYNLAAAGETVAGSYWNMRLALQETKPKLVVLDTYIITSIAKYDNKEKLHWTLDLYQPSLLKYEAIKDLLDDAGQTANLDDIVEYLFPFSLYHSRWSSLTEQDFTPKKDYGKGADYEATIVPVYNTVDYESVEITDDVITQNADYLKKIIEYCKDNHIALLLTYLPNDMNERQVGGAKLTAKIAEENDINYINLLNDKSIIDPLVDYKDDMKNNAHLNIAGSKKVSEYIGKFIMENYEIPDRSVDANYSYWHQDYNEYIDDKANSIITDNDLRHILVWLYDEDNFEYEIVLANETVLKDPTTKILVERLGYKIDSETFSNRKDASMKITIRDARNNKELRTIWR